VLRREPRACGYDRTRWTLALLRTACPELRVRTDGSLHHLLHRLGLSYQRARLHVRSPDPHYEVKLARVAELLAAVRQSAGRLVLCYLDELTYYRQPTVAPTWAATGEQPRAEQSHRANTSTRVAAVLNAVSAQVQYVQSSKCGLPVLVQLYQQVRQAYPHAETIWVVQDNWPVHYHPDVLVALAPQTNPWAPKLPPCWPTQASASAQRRWGHLQLPIQLVSLPTYASWTNPIEKLWRWLKQDVLHLHRHADDLDALRRQVTTFLDQFAHGSTDLLRYVGMVP